MEVNDIFLMGVVCEENEESRGGCRKYKLIYHIYIVISVINEINIDFGLGNFVIKIVGGRV